VYIERELYQRIKMLQKNRGGRPKFEITPEICEQVENLSAQGLTVDQIASVLGVSRQTIYERQNEYPEFSDALKRGRGKGVANVTNALYTKAIDGDNTAMIFYLKNRAGWVDKQEVQSTVEQRHVIDLTRIPDDQLEQLENAFKQPDSRTGDGREVSEIIEGVYEG
jgi:transcriptional regulator with XRE-family HTH domain